MLGFSAIFMALGASATALGQALLRWRYELNIIGGAIVIFCGLFMIGAARLAAMERDVRLHLDLPGAVPSPLMFLASPSALAGHPVSDQCSVRS